MVAAVGVVLLGMDGLDYLQMKWVLALAEVA
jgi:hypothetical protein